MNNEKEVLFSVSHLKKYFQVGKNATLKAVDDVSFEIYKARHGRRVWMWKDHMWTNLYRIVQQN